MTLAAAHATLQALVAPPRARAGAGRPPRASRARRDLHPSSLPARKRLAAHRRGETIARGMEDGGGATDIVIPDTFVPPSRELRGAEKPYFPPVGVADDPTLANPLQRQRMLSTEWFGCVFELEGALVKARDAEHRASWMRLAKEREQTPPPEMVLKFASTMKPEDFVSRQLRWTRDPMEVRRLVQRRAEIYEEILEEQIVLALEKGSTPPPRDELLPGVLPFLRLMKQAHVPMAATCGTKTFRAACDALEKLEILEFFANERNPQGEPNVVSSEDVSDWLPDPLPIERAAQLMDRTTKRCVVFGDNNTVTEAATECGAKSVLLLGRQPRYELQGADAVVASLKDVTVSNLKNLFADETSEAAEPQREVEIFPTAGRSTRAAVADYFDYDAQTQSDDAGGKEPPLYKSRRRRRDV
jgi:beta-phosphoglucomutase-like phosphatase (HAD superfamily)